ncbi:MAG: hypothetical protein EXR72_22100 [Myxococcales bacterium]|nr:hypothetical protein [Myxococcales bacterium]
MPRAKKSVGAQGAAPIDTADLLALLSPERRQALLEEALGSRVRGLFQEHQDSTFGALVRALTGDTRWELLRRVPFAAVLRAQGGAAAASPPTKAARRRGRKTQVDASVLETLLQFIKKTPGLRSEAIQKRVSLDPKVIKLGLSKLRDQKLVTTSGHKRATTYAAS